MTSTPLDLLVAEMKLELRNNRAKRKSCELARSFFRPATWAEEAATLYYFVNPDRIHASVQRLALLMMEFPTTILAPSAHMDAYANEVASLAVPLSTGNNFLAYEDIFSRLAPTLPSLMIVEDGNALIAELKRQKKTVQNFFQWSVGDYPLPNLHTHLVFQPVPNEG
jgi:hypothetical protein